LKIENYTQNSIPFDEAPFDKLRAGRAGPKLKK
jgi:hypothetical protein